MSGYWWELPNDPDLARTHRVNPVIVIADPMFRLIRVSTVVRWREPDPLGQEPAVLTEQIFGDGPPDDLTVRAALERWTRSAELDDYRGPSLQGPNPNFRGTDIANAAAALLLQGAYRSVRNLLAEAHWWKNELANMIERGDDLIDGELPAPSPPEFAALHNLAVWEWRTGNDQELSRTLQSLNALRIYDSLAPSSEILVREVRSIAGTTRVA